MRPSEYIDELNELKTQIDRLVNWLETAALPLWLNEGRDQVSGGFYERIDQTGRPCASDNRRSRVQTRQTYCFATAGYEGWNESWQEGVRTGLDWMGQVFQKDSDYIGNLASARGELIDPSVDIYNQAFAIFAFASTARVLENRKSEMEENACRLLASLNRDFKHPLGGYGDAAPSNTPLCSNPHMHLLEAALEWEQIASTPVPWIKLADDIIELALDRLIEPDSGLIREYFDHSWSPFSGEMGRIIEPGHLFEWAWLIERWGLRRDDSRARAIAATLFNIGTDYGICEHRGVAVMRIYDDLSVCDPDARLWPQTEWLKAAVTLAAAHHGAKRKYYLFQATRAISAFQIFLETPVKGLWYDRVTPNGDFREEPAPASSFYHIVGAIYETRRKIASMCT